MFISLFWIFSSNTGRAQNKVTISGYIKDSLSGETLPGATIILPESQLGTASNHYGFFSITINEGKHAILIQYVGYRSKQLILDINKDIHLNIEIREDIQLEKEVVITSKNSRRNIESPEMGVVEIDIDKVKSLPAIMGEADIMKTIQLLPGVQASGEGNTGMFVRGGGADQNLVLLDEATIYNTGHLFGFFSVFNSDAIKSATLHKGNMPANYGGRISSVIDFSMKEGNYKKYSASGGIGLIASRLTLEGPIVKDKSSFIVSGRRTYIDILSKPFFESNGLKGVPYYFYDLNIKANYKISEKDKVFISGYLGKDEVILSLVDGRFKSNIDWGNKTLTLRWNHQFSPKIFMNTSAIYNTYGFTSKATFDNFNTRVDSKIIDYNLKTDVDYFPSIRTKIKFGGQFTHHTFIPRRADASASNVAFNASINSTKFARDISFYFSSLYSLTEKIEINGGVRLNIFQQVGPYISIFRNDQGKIDTTDFKNGEPVVSFVNPEPRLGIRLSLNESSSLKAAANLNNQYIHQVSLTGNALPFDIWVPSSRIIKPQRGLQYSLGYFKNLDGNTYEFSMEGYYKTLWNQIEYSQYYVPKVSGEIENDFVFGKGQSYGVEFFLNKKLGKLQGWIAYTLSRATRTFAEINDGITFPARYDRRHDVSVVATYDISEKWTLGSAFVFASGQPITIPERRYVIEGSIYNQYGLRNSYRMQPYNRLDLSATYKRKRPNAKFESSWTFAVYNVYNRKNPFIYYVDTDGSLADGNLTVKAKKLYLFPILPSITWNFKF